MQTVGDAGKGGTSLGAGLVTNGDDISEAFAGGEHVRDGFGLVAGNVYADFLHGFDNNGIEFAGFEAGAVGFELLAANVIQERFRHLAAGAVMDADEENFFLFIVHNTF